VSFESKEARKLWQVQERTGGRRWENVGQVVDSRQMADAIILLIQRGALPWSRGRRTA
jgi:hypothetical protein